MKLFKLLSIIALASVLQLSAVRWLDPVVESEEEVVVAKVPETSAAWRSARSLRPDVASAPLTVTAATESMRPSYVVARGTGKF